MTYALLDRAGMIHTANLAAARLFQTTRRQLIGRPLVAFVSRKDRCELIDHFARCGLSQGIVESEIRFVGNAAGLVTCRIYSKRVWYEGRPAYPTVIIDQTEGLRLEEARRNAEREKQAAQRATELAWAGNAAKDRFLATVSHELRTPLTPALLAASQLATWAGLPGEARALADTIKRNIQFEARLIEDLLDVARINRNRIVVSLETTDAHELVQEAIDICRPSADARKQTLTVALLAPQHHVRADPSRLRQVFWNLLTNAIKFTPAGGEIIVRSVNISEDVLKISIRDSGEGMDAEVLENLFAPFDRHSPEHDSRGGLGLGLSISKGIIAAHEGQIWATSDGPQRGSTFAVELATVPEPAVQRETGSKVGNQAPLPERPRVLVVEDNADSRTMIVTFLSKYGYDVEAAATFDEAVERLDQAWDVVLTDLSLPGGSGLEIARRARALEKPPQRLIAFSGYGSADDLRASREAGFDNHLVKPLDLDGLLKAVGPPGHKPDVRKVSVVSSFRARAKRT